MYMTVIIIIEIFTNIGEDKIKNKINLQKFYL